MDFQQIRDFVNPAVAQATGLQEVENLSMPVPVAYVPVQLVIDGALSLTSENPVQNKVIAVAIQQLDGRITAIEGQFSEGVTEAVNNWLAAHPEATTTVQDGAITYAKLDANLKGEVDQISDLKSAFESMRTATDKDAGKVLKAKTVADGKVTEWEFGTGTEPVITGLSYDDEDVVTYSSTNGSTGANQTAVVIAPNVTTGYFVKSATVYAPEGTNIKFSVFKIAPYYTQPNLLNRKKFTKVYDLAVIPADEDGKAEIAFDVPLHLVGGDTVLVAACNESVINKRMKYGAYKDAQYTIFEYDKNWYDLQPGEFYDNGSGYFYITSGNCPTYDITYVAESDATTETFTADQILQQRENLNPFDSKIDKRSNNAVRNSALYNELNIVKTETIVPTDTTWKNGEAVQAQIYNGWFTIVYVNETDAVNLKELDIFATTGTSVRLGIWTFRPWSEQVQNRGCLTLKSVLDTVVSENNHAIFTLNNVAFDPSTEFLGVAASSGGIGCNTGVVNGFAGFWFNSDAGFYNTQVGSENSTIIGKPGRTDSTSGTVQGNYLITYQLAESKTITTTTNVKDAVDGLLDDVDELKNQSDPIANEMLRTPINKYFVVIVDDVTRDALTVADQLIDIGVRPAFALKMETMGVDITWEEVKKLQDMGFEICFHGMLHSRYHPETAPADDAVMIADIAEYKALCKAHGIVLHGYAGPVHYPLPVGAFKEFEWARYPYGLQAYGAPNHLATTFASVSVYSADVMNNQVPVADLIAGANNVGDNQYLTPMLHCQNLVAYLNDYLTVFNSWINAGLTPIRPMDAVKQSLFNAGGIGNNSTFEIQAGTATNPYYLISGNGTVLHNP